MALFENNGDQSTEKKQYIVLRDKTGEDVAYINPVKTVSKELLVKSLSDKGLSVEIRESKGDVLELEL